MRYVPTTRWTIAILAAFCCCIVAAGHGVAPLGLFFLFGAFEAPVQGCIALLALALLPIGASSGSRVAYGLGLAGLGTMWVLAYRFADIRSLLVLTSVPFLFLLAVQLRDVVLGVEE